MVLRASLTAAALTFVALNLAYATPQAPEGGALARPDVATWTTLGTTLRMDRDHNDRGWQMRHIQMAPADYLEFVRTGVYPDGAMFSASFYSVELDTTHTPPFYRANEDVGFALEVIDRSHPDGRRFYTFQVGQTEATALPAGNACAVCHNTRASFDGTFADAYPVIQRHLTQRE